METGPRVLSHMGRKRRTESKASSAAVVASSSAEITAPLLRALDCDEGSEDERPEDEHASARRVATATSAGDVRMIGNLLGDTEAPIEIGSEVEAVFEDHSDDDGPYTLVQWRVA